MAKFNIEKAMEIARSGDEEKLRKLFAGIESRLSQKRYGLIWERGGEDEDSGFEVENIVLDYKAGIPYPKFRADLSTNPENANGNMLLEGDNYIWLKTLEQTHANAIAICYIDPTYNTGHDDFKYNDKYVNLDDTFRHSKWLNMIELRLKVAKNLLTDDGLIFISIGDQELANLILLCDAIFGEDNRIAIIPRVAKKGSNKGTYFRPTKDYVLCYARDITKIKPFWLPMSNDDKEYKFTETTGPNSGRKYKKGHSLFQASLDSRPNQRYYIEAPDGTLIIPPGNVFPDKEEDAAFVLPLNNADKCYRWSWETYLARKAAGEIMFAKSKRSPMLDSNRQPTEWNVYEKKYLDETDIKKTLPDDIIYDYQNAQGTAALSDIGLEFSFSKPVGLIKYLIYITHKADDITILDFFAGSGTTAQAVEELNQEDGGRRKWILITNNEDQDADDGDPDTGICRDITKPRIDTVITGKRLDGSAYSDGTNSGYLYFQYDFLKRVRHLYTRNAERFFKPYIIDALIPIKHSVARTIQDSKNTLCVYESDTKKVIAIFKDPTLEDVHNAIEEHFADDDRRHLLILPEGASLYKAIVKELVKIGVDVQYQHNLISTAGYLE